MLRRKTTGFYLDYSEYSVQVARTRQHDGALILEDLAEFSLNDHTGEDRHALLREFLSLKKGQYAISRCGIAPAGRFVRRTTLDGPVRGKGGVFLPDSIRQQLKVDPEACMIAVLNADTGSEFDAARSSLQREVVFCGAPEEEILLLQSELVETMVYPDRMEIGMLATTGGLTHYTREMNIEQPVLYADIGWHASHALVVHPTQLGAARPITSGTRQMAALLQRECGCENEAVAEAMLYQGDFDELELTPLLLKGLIRELEAAIGQFEIQTGQVVGSIFVGALPVGLRWVGPALARALQIEWLQIDYPQWLGAFNIKPGVKVDFSNLDSHWFGLFSLMGSFTPNLNGTKATAGGAGAQKKVE